MRNHCFSAAIAIAVAVLLLASTPAYAGSTNYKELVPNGGEQVLLHDLVTGEVPGLIVGDKWFDNFNYSWTGDMPAADRVAVTAVTDADGNFGVQFQGAFIDRWDGADIEEQIPSDAGITFDVSVAPEAAALGWRIADAHLFGAGTGNFALAGPGAFIAVDENFVGNDPMINEGMTVFASNPPNQEVTGIQLEDWIFFDHLYERLRVQKDIVALTLTDDSSLPARMSLITQTFSQRIPEPTAWVLLSMAVVGLSVAKRRQHAVA